MHERITVSVGMWMYVTCNLQYVNVLYTESALTLQHVNDAGINLLL